MQISPDGDIMLDSGGFHKVGSPPRPDWSVACQCSARHSILASGRLHSLPEKAPLSIFRVLHARSLCPFLLPNETPVGKKKTVGKQWMPVGWQAMTLGSFNDVLAPVGIKITAPEAGRLEDSQWLVSDGRSLYRFQDGMVHPPALPPSQGSCPLRLPR